MIEDATLQFEADDCVFMLSREHLETTDVARPAIRLESLAELALVEAVRRALDSTGYLELRNLDVKISDDFVQLDGRVRSYYMKQVAQSAAKSVRGVARVLNHVEVVSGR